MSKKDQKNAQGGMKRILIILLIVLLFACFVSLAVWTWLEMKKIKGQLAEKSPDVAAHHIIASPVYVPLDTFTVSLKPETEEGEHVLYLGLTLKVRSDKDKVLLGKYLPEVRSRLLLLLAQQSSSVLSTDTGKAQLTKQIRSTLSEPVAENELIDVTDVLFNAFILR